MFLGKYSEWNTDFQHFYRWCPEHYVLVSPSQQCGGPLREKNKYFCKMSQHKRCIKETCKIHQIPGWYLFPTNDLSTNNWKLPLTYNSNCKASNCDKHRPDLLKLIFYWFFICSYMKLSEFSSKLFLTHRGQNWLSLLCDRVVSKRPKKNIPRRAH